MGFPELPRINLFPNNGTLQSKLFIIKESEIIPNKALKRQKLNDESEINLNSKSHAFMHKGRWRDKYVPQLKKLLSQMFQKDHFMH